MIICPICNKELPDDARYCDGCGTPFIRDDMCWNCNAFITPGEAYCPACGAAQYAENASQYNTDTYAQQDYYETQPTYETEAPAYDFQSNYSQPAPVCESNVSVDPPVIEQPPQPSTSLVVEPPLFEVPKPPVAEPAVTSNIEQLKPPVIEPQNTQTPKPAETAKPVSVPTLANDIPIKNTIPVQKNIQIQPNIPLKNNPAAQSAVPVQDNTKISNSVADNTAVHNNIPIQSVTPPAQNNPVQNNIPIKNTNPVQSAPIAQNAPAQPFMPQNIPNKQNIPVQSGTPIPQNIPVQNWGAANQSPNYTAPAMQKTKTRHKKKSKKIFIFGGAGIALLLTVAIVLSSLFIGGSNYNYGMYLKDNEIFYTKISKINPIQLTSSLIDEDAADEIDSDDYSNIGYSLSNYITFSNDGKTIFFVDNIDGDSEGATIYYRSVNNQKMAPVKIDSDIRNYSINDSANLVTYIKAGDEKLLYQHNLKDKEKIASDVSDYYVTNDGKKILFVNSEGTMYLKNKGKDKEKIDSDVTDIVYHSDELNTVYYLKEDVLYKKADGKDKVKISSDISDVLGVYDSGEIYYTKRSSEELSLIDYVDDDLKGSDALMTEPTAPDYPSYFDYDSYDDYSAAVDQYRLKYSEYTDARSEYYDKLERDELRKDLESKTLSYSCSSLYYFDGDNELKLTDSVAENEYGFDYEISYGSPMLIFPVFEESETEKIKISEINDISDLKEAVEDALYSSARNYIAIEKTLTAIDCENAENFLISNDENTVYFVDNVDEGDHGELYKMVISGQKPKKPELYDSDVYVYSIYMYSDDSIIYYKDVDESKGELYLNKELIDSDVKLYNIYFIGDYDGFTYMTDWSSKKSYGTLKKYNGSKSEKISDDVYTYVLTPNDEILYLYDYSTKNHLGELRLYKGKKSIKVDDDVTAIIPVW